MTSSTMAYPQAPLLTPVAARLALRKPDVGTSRNAPPSKRSRVRFALRTFLFSPFGFRGNIPTSTYVDFARGVMQETRSEDLADCLVHQAIPGFSFFLLGFEQTYRLVCMLTCCAQSRTKCGD